MRLHIKDVKKNQIIYDRDLANRYKVWEDPYQDENGVWHVMVVDGGDQEWTFHEGLPIWDDELREDYFED